MAGTREAWFRAEAASDDGRCSDDVAIFQADAGSPPTLHQDFLHVLFQENLAWLRPASALKLGVFESQLVAQEPRSPLLTDLRRAASGTSRLRASPRLELKRQQGLRCLLSGNPSRCSSCTCLPSCKPQAGSSMGAESPSDMIMRSIAPPATTILQLRSHHAGWRSVGWQSLKQEGKHVHPVLDEGIGHLGRSRHLLSPEAASETLSPMYTQILNPKPGGSETKPSLSPSPRPSTSHRTLASSKNWLKGSDSFCGPPGIDFLKKTGFRASALTLGLTRV